MVHPDQRFIDALMNNDVVLLKELYRNYFDKMEAAANQLSRNKY